MTIIRIKNPTRSSLPRPTRDQLFSTAESVWNHCEAHAHDIEAKGNDIDRFLASCLRVASSNLMAIVKLSAAYHSECGSIMRNLVETCVDYFWVASFFEAQPAKAERIASNFFLYGKSKYLEAEPAYRNYAVSDVFLRDVPSPFADEEVLNRCRKELEGRIFGKTWRFDPEIFAKESETSWRSRCEAAATFAERSVNLKGAPYLINLRTYSSYSHFDPAQIDMRPSLFRDRLYDRNLNIAIGFCFDMLTYSYLRMKWKHPEELMMLQHNFIWFST